MDDHQIGYPYERIELMIDAKITETVRNRVLQRKIGTDAEVTAEDNSKDYAQTLEVLYTILHPE